MLCSALSIIDNDNHSADILLSSCAPALIVQNPTIPILNLLVCECIHQTHSSALRDRVREEPKLKSFHISLDHTIPLRSVSSSKQQSHNPTEQDMQQRSMFHIFAHTKSCSSQPHHYCSMSSPSLSCSLLHPHYDSRALSSVALEHEMQCNTRHNINEQTEGLWCTLPHPPISINSHPPNPELPGDK